MTEATREVAGQYGPVLLSGVVASGGLLVDQSMAAMLPSGSVSALVYANRFVSVVLTLLAGAVSTAIVPYFSRMIAHRDWAGCRHTLRTWVRLTAFVSVPVAIALIADARPLVRIAFQHGQFGPRDTAVVASVLAMYAIQIPFFVTSRVYYRFLVAMRRTDLILYCGILNLGLDIVLNLVLMRWFGVAGIALATSLWTVSTFFYLWYWSRRLLARAQQRRQRDDSGPAQYLLRFDDLCPTVSRDRWRRLRFLIEEFRLQPILAVVPENRDPDLDLSLPDPAFWEQMRALESAGAVIGLHGYRHLCQSECRSLLGLHRMSEFAGIAAEMQREWIHDGLRILRSHGLNPRIWVAPRHGFDKHTLEALRAEGINLLSDGFARAPFLRHGVTWIPQQLWGPAGKPKGLWTICVHPNTASDADIESLCGFLAAHANQFTSIDQILFRFQPATLTLPERLQAEAALWRLKSLRAVRRIRRRALFRPSNSA